MKKKEKKFSQHKTSNEFSTRFTYLIKLWTIPWGFPMDYSPSSIYTLFPLNTKFIYMQASNHILAASPRSPPCIHIINWHLNKTVNRERYRGIEREDSNIIKFITIGIDWWALQYSFSNFFFSNSHNLVF